MTHGTKPAHLARATFEAIAHQIADVFEAMQADTGQRLSTFSADGGASGNAFLMQLQADLIDRPVRVSRIEEIGAFGVAGMAMAAMGGTLAPLSDATMATPQMDPAIRYDARDRWARAIRQATG